jgi:4-amino-4-deoxy-L-arabinose transferase-like glycosyltransferase
LQQIGGAQVNTAHRARRQHAWRWPLYVALAIAIALGLMHAPVWLFAAGMGLSLAVALFALARLPAGEGFRRGMRRIPPLLLAALIAALLAGGALLGVASGSPFLSDSLWPLALYGLAIALLPLLWWLGGPPAPGRSRAATRAAAGRWRLAPLMAGTALLLFLLQINNLPLEGTPLPVKALLGLFTPAVQLALLVIGIGLLVRGAAGSSARVMRRPPALSALALGAILLLALVLRLWDLGGWTHFYHDEQHFAEAVSKIWAGDPIRILQPFNGAYEFTWLYPLLQSLTAWITGPDLLGLRLASALVGTLGVAAVYALARELGGRRLALLAALLMAVFPFHIHFSHIGIYVVADTLFGTLGLWMLVRGLRTGETAAWAWSGAFLGLSQFFYEGGRLFFVPFAILLLGWLVVVGDGRMRYRPTRRSLLAWAVVGGVVVFLPTWILLAGEGHFLPRYNTVGLDDANLSVLLERPDPVLAVVEHVALPLLRVTQFSNTTHDWFYGLRSPILMPLWVPLFVLGFGVALWRMRTSGGALLVWWVTGAFAGLALLTDPTGSPRYLPVAPALVLAVAYGSQESLRWVLAAVRGWGAPWLQPALAGGMLALIAATPALYSTAIQLPQFYYDMEYRRAARGGVSGVDRYDAVLRIVELPADSQVTLILYGDFWQYDLRVARVYHGRDDLTISQWDRGFPESEIQERLYRLPRYRPQAFFLPPGYTQVRAVIEDTLGPPTRVTTGDRMIPGDVKMLMLFYDAETLAPPPVSWLLGVQPIEPLENQDRASGRVFLSSTAEEEP